MPGGGGRNAPRLVSPSAQAHASFLEALAECHAEGRHLELPAERLSDPDEFSRFVAALRAGVERPGEPDFYLAELRGEAPPVPWPDGYAPQSVYWWLAGDEFIGRVNIRHRLTPHLMIEGGHIGFEVRPSARRMGHATAMLAAALPLAAALGIDPARLDCDEDNPASRRVIEKNGGHLVGEASGVLYFEAPTR